MVLQTLGEAVTRLAADTTDVDHEDFARLCLDRTRLAALGRAVEGSLSADALGQAMDIRRRDALEAIADLRLAGLIEEDGGLVGDALRTIAGTLPRPAAASPAITEGDWSKGERKVLRTFFSGHRLIEIPVNRSKRRLVLERLAQEFGPGARYDERDVNERLRSYHEDYAALRRYLVDEGILTRADGVYWRTGGRFPLDSIEESRPGHAATPNPRVILDTERGDVVLVTLDTTTPESLVAAANDVRIVRYMADAFPHPYALSDATDWLAYVRGHEPPLHFAVLVDGDLVGGVGCQPKHDISTGSAEIGWWLNPFWWGKGLATAAVQRFIRYCFDDLGLHRVEAGVFLDNPASARVADKCGMVLEGISTDAYTKAGTRIDRLNYGLARSTLDDDRPRRLNGRPTTSGSPSTPSSGP